MDAVLIRLPTIIVRPGRPNKAASSFFSGILREPLLGLETDLPVGDDFAVWVARFGPNTDARESGDTAGLGAAADCGVKVAARP